MINVVYVTICIYIFFSIYGLVEWFLPFFSTQSDFLHVFIWTFSYIQSCNLFYKLLSRISTSWLSFGVFLNYSRLWSMYYFLWYVRSTSFFAISAIVNHNELFFFYILRYNFPFVTRSVQEMFNTHRQHHVFCFSVRLHLFCPRFSFKQVYIYQCLYIYCICG